MSDLKFTPEQTLLTNVMLKLLAEVPLTTRSDREIFAPIAAGIINTKEAAPDMYAALQPFAKIAEEAKKLGHGPGSTSEWRLKYDDLMAVVAALAKAMKL